MIIHLRDVDGTEVAEYNTIKDALQYEAEGLKKPILAWEDRTKVCCLDVDDVLLDTEQIVTLFNLIKPAPVAAWISHSGAGLHLIYEEVEPLKADELAGLAILWLRNKLVELNTFELLHHTFFPPGEIFTFEKVTDISSLASFMEDKVVDEILIEEWLSKHDMKIGGRYDHKCCVIDPTQPASRDPVIVYPEGIYCFACQGRTGKGFRYFSQLCGQVVPRDLTRMIQNKTHWEHAKYVMRELTELNDNINEVIYRASLVYKHGVNVRDCNVFYPRRNIIRIGRWWATEMGESYNNNINGLLASLPTCTFISDKGVIKTNKGTLTRLGQTTDITELGYPSLNVIRGCKVYGQFLKYNSKEYKIVLPNGILSKEDYTQYRPKYLPKQERDESWAWDVLEKPFPNLNRKAIKLLIAARGTAEGQIGLPSFIYISGPTSSAKTSSVLIAAAILGDVTTSVIWSNDMERVRQGILEGKEKGWYVTFNEICKQAKKNGVSFRQAMDDCLNLTPESVSHKLYVGPVPLGILPVCVWTDTEIPKEIRDSSQLARRIIHIHMPNKVDWKQALTDLGIFQIERLRVSGSDYAKACDIILSETIDEFFMYPQDLESIAQKLGFYTLEAEGSDETEDVLCKFFRTICDSPCTISGSDANRWSGRGWKIMQIGESTDLGDIWGSLCDTDSSKSSRRCSEANWPKIIGQPGPIEFECQHHGQKIVVRFIKRTTRKDYLVNEEIVKCQENGVTNKSTNGELIKE